jgi:hypothetical protein
MVKIKRIGILSAGLMLGALYAVLGLIAGGILTMMSLAGFAAAGGGQDAVGALIFGGGAIIILPLFYGTMGFIGGILMSFVYNVVAMMVGGVAVELEGAADFV